MSDYEVWCARCEVSFPVGTRRCMHCGARTVAERPAKSSGRAVVSYSVKTDPRWSVAPPSSSRSNEPFAEASDTHFAEAEEEEEAPQRRLLRAGMSLVWMVLLAAGYIWQNCARPS